MYDYFTPFGSLFTPEIAPNEPGLAAKPFDLGAHAFQCQSDCDGMLDYSGIVNCLLWLIRTALKTIQQLKWVVSSLR